MNWIKTAYKDFLMRFIIRSMATDLQELLAMSLTHLVIRGNELEARVSQIKNRYSNYYRCRYDAIDSVADYLVPSQLPGDFMEFGVYKDTIFSYAYKASSPLFQEMRFVAFDSFEGMPTIRL